MTDSSTTDLLDSILLSKILHNEEMETSAKVEFLASGCEDGDGYGSHNIAVVLEDYERKLELFIKYILRSSVISEYLFNVFDIECNFYNLVAPAFAKFAAERKATQFNGIPKCYMAESNGQLIAIVLENLRKQGFRMGKRQAMDKDHLMLVFRKLAEFHAFSFAMKDQQRELYDSISEKLHDYLPIVYKLANIMETAEIGFQKILSELSGDCRAKLQILADNVMHVLNTTGQESQSYEIITHGDCWSNNSMFSYTEDGIPVDMRMIDFQLVRSAPPVFDLSFYFYSSADKGILNDMNSYLEYYYEVLSERLLELGSDPSSVYPKEIFYDQWQRFSLFGIGVGVTAIKVALFDKEEIPEGESLLTKFNTLLSRDSQNQDKYLQRLRDLFQHSIEYLQI